MIDLHLHSTASDGSLEPAALVRAAREAGLRAVALTDHDTTAGVAEALAAGEREGIEVVPGVEVSVEHGAGTCHLIGLFVDPEDAGLSAELARLRAARRERNWRIVEKLGRLGLPVTAEEVTRLSGGGVTGRPHFARAMVARGYVPTAKAAFVRWLRKGGAAYVERYRTAPAEAIRLMREAGGVSVLCHPHLLGLGEGDRLREFAGRLAATGLDALEAWYPDLGPRQREALRALAGSLGLLVSGGSDFHGPSPPSPPLGSAGAPDEVLEDLRRRAARS